MMNAGNNPPKNCRMHNGIVYLNDKPQFFVGGEYPYYRDFARNWKDRLEKMKEAGINVISFKIPWRHHFLYINKQGNQVFDFTGKTKANRNLIRFLNIIEKLGLFACLKPGPFVQGEIDYGGLPDFVNPDQNNLINAYRNHLALEGKKNLSKNRWPKITGKSLPSPFNFQFKKRIKEFFKMIAKEVASKKIFPMGPIIMVQLGNEGYYSDGNWPLSITGNYNYNNIQAFRNFLLQKYDNIEQYNKCHNTELIDFQDILPPRLYKGNNNYKNLEDLQIIADWSDFGVERFIEWLVFLKKSFSFENDPIFITNWNLPHNLGIGIDIWNSQINIEKIQLQSGVHFGFTNWVLPVNYHNASYMKYGLGACRSSGINLEENWGFARLKDVKYKHGPTSLYQTLLSCAYGGTGYNIYTAVGTSNYGNLRANPIDTQHDRPYPSHPPISDRGDYNSKYYIMAGLNKFFGEYFGVDFLESQQESFFGLGYYPYYSHLAAFAGHDPKIWKKLGLISPPVFGQDAFVQFHDAMRHMKLDYSVINLEIDPFDTYNQELPDSHQNSEIREIITPKILIVVASRIMSKKIQQKILKYISSGGIFCLFGQMPEIDEKFESCTLLKDAFPSFTQIKTINDKCIGEKACYLPHKKGYFLFRRGNPLASSRGVAYYLLDFFIRAFLLPLRAKIPKNREFQGKLIPYSVYQGKLGGDATVPRLKRNSLKTFNLLLRFLQNKGIYREVEITLRTEYIFRRKIETFVYTHPKQNVQYIFLFSKETPFTLPVSLNLHYPNRKTSVRIKTKILGHTAQLLRIQDGRLTGLIYNGINPVNKIKEPMEIKVNKFMYKSSHAMNLVYLSNSNHEEFYITHNTSKNKATLIGFQSKKISVDSNTHHLNIPVPNSN